MPVKRVSGQELLGERPTCTARKIHTGQTSVRAAGLGPLQGPGGPHTAWPQEQLPHSLPTRLQHQENFVSFPGDPKSAIKLKISWHN